MSGPQTVYRELTECKTPGCTNMINQTGWNSPRSKCRFCVIIKQKETDRLRSIIRGGRWMTAKQKKKIPDIEEICNGL